MSFTFRIKCLEEFQTAPEVLDLRANALPVATGNRARRWVMRDCMAQVGDLWQSLRGMPRAVAQNFQRAGREPLAGRQLIA